MRTSRRCKFAESAHAHGRRPALGRQWLFRSQNGNGIKLYSITLVASLFLLSLALYLLPLQLANAGVISGNEVAFVSSTTWRVPEGISSIRAHVWGRGGCRNSPGMESSNRNCGTRVMCMTTAFSGGYDSKVSYVTPGQYLTISISATSSSIPELSLSASAGSNAYFTQRFITSTSTCGYSPSTNTGSSGGPTPAGSAVMYSGNFYTAGQGNSFQYCNSLPANGLVVVEWENSYSTLQNVPSGFFVIPSGSWTWSVPPGMSRLRFHAIAAQGCAGSEYYGWTGWRDFGSYASCPGAAGGEGGYAMGEVVDPITDSSYSFTATSGGMQVSQYLVEQF